jgi:DNA-binding Lrp family transcriptional regulator
MYRDAHSRLDETDLSLLAMLQKDGRMTNVELATSVGLTAPPCLRRVKALEQEGIIQSYHAVLDPCAWLYDHGFCDGQPQEPGGKRSARI